MKDAENWSKVIMGLYMQASLYRSVCFPLMRDSETGWEDDLALQMDSHKKDFEEINEVIKKKLTQLKNKYLSNGKKALPEYFGNDENWVEGRKLMVAAYQYLNGNFNPGEGIKWNVVVLPTDKVNHVHGDFAIVDRKGWSVYAQYGPLSRQAVCNEEYPFIATKQLRCQMIGCHHFNYKPVGDTSLIDSSSYTGYVPYVKSERCDIYDRK